MQAVASGTGEGKVGYSLKSSEGVGMGWVGVVWGWGSFIVVRF